MIANWFRIAFRSLRSRLGYTLLNVVGLAVGMACCLLIGLYVQNELSYDSFHSKSDRIVRVVQKESEGGQAQIGDAILPILSDRIPQVKKTVRVKQVSRPIAHKRGGSVRRFEEDQFFFADTTFFDVFSGFTLRKGNPETALDRPGTAVITPEIAQKYFGSADPMGKTLRVTDSEQTLTVTGVLEPIPPNSHLQIDFVSGFDTYLSGEGLPAGFRSNSFWFPLAWTYALLEPNASRETAEQQLADAVASQRSKDDASKYRSVLQPLTSLHLYSNLDGEPRGKGGITQVYIFSSIALLVLLIAAVNFVNLSTARASERATEVGVRRAIGAHREQLAGQFLGEAVLLSMGAAAVAVLLVQAALPAFTSGLGIELAVGIWSNGWFWLGVVGVVLITGVGAGSYPAFVLSSFSPATVLKNTTSQQGWGERWFQKGLVVFQFAISVALIGVTVVAQDQAEYLRTARLGFDQERLVAIDAAKNYSTLSSELKQLTEIKNVTAASVTPGLQEGIPYSYEIEGEPPTDRRKRLSLQRVALNFFDILGVETVAGRMFAENRPGDLGRALETETGPPHYRDVALVVNESLLEKFDWTPEEALDKQIRLYQTSDGSVYKDVRGKVIGVIEDYHSASLHTEISPTVYVPGKAPAPGKNESIYRGISSTLVKVSPGTAPSVMRALRGAWSRVVPGQVFDASFLNDQLRSQYRSERRLSRAVGVLAGLAILVACLGLFGLATYSTQRRTQEIGIRKAVGASAASIVGLLSTDFLKLVMWAIAIGTPLAYLIVRQWLQNFAYHVDLGPMPFALAGGSALAIAALTVSYHSLRAARLNPTIALREE